MTNNGPATIVIGTTTVVAIATTATTAIANIATITTSVNETIPAFVTAVVNLAPSYVTTLLSPFFLTNMTVLLRQPFPLPSLHPISTTLMFGLSIAVHVDTTLRFHLTESS